MAGQAHGYNNIIKYLAIQDNKRILISEKDVPVFQGCSRCTYA